MQLPHFGTCSVAYNNNDMFTLESERVHLYYFQMFFIVTDGFLSSSQVVTYTL